jgi:hypothetical protein
MIKNTNKQNGIATIAIVLLIIVGIGAIGGVAYFIKNKEPRKESAEDINPERNQARVFQYEDLPKGALGDLVIGETVAVRGIENQDGSITANLIFIGMPEQGFFQGERIQDREEHRMPEGMDIDFEEMRNLSPEEIRARMQELRDSGQMPSMEGRIGRMGSGTAFVRGEIIDKDEISITIKIEEGGSKLVFYSKDIQIIKTEEAEEEK